MPIRFRRRDDPVSRAIHRQQWTKVWIPRDNAIASNNSRHETNPSTLDGERMAHACIQDVLRRPKGTGLEIPSIGIDHGPCPRADGTPVLPSRDAGVLHAGPSATLKRSIPVNISGLISCSLQIQSYYPVLRPSCSVCLVVHQRHPDGLLQFILPGSSSPLRRPLPKLVARSRAGERVRIGQEPRTGEDRQAERDCDSPSLQTVHWIPFWRSILRELNRTVTGCYERKARRTTVVIERFVAPRDRLRYQQAQHRCQTRVG